MNDENHWSVDRRIPIATMVMFLIQTAGMVWWAASLQATVDQHSKMLIDFQINGTPGVRERLGIVNSQVLEITRRLDKVDTNIDRVGDKIDKLSDKK